VEGTDDHGEGWGAFGVGGVRLGVLRVEALFGDDLLRRRVDPRFGGEASKFPHLTSPAISFCIVSSPANQLRNCFPGEFILVNEEIKEFKKCGYLYSFILIFILFKSDGAYLRSA
jgi:hypothetical protein